ncbi:LysR family transcriptional regulator [Actinosynnema sp. NPDC050801]|uniref:LysR family transcriptional regulator n=1 Tax=unclassified Actinosynnema TaxID=2637065 RepID=UPI0033D1A8B2
MLDVRRLRLLRDLAHLGTIAAVARAHAYTPSAVSQQLAALQREAGVPLLEHTGRGVRLTPAGSALVEHAETILAALEAASATVAAARTGLSGAVRIGAFPSAVPTLLPSALVALGHDHPALDLMVTELDPVDVPDALRDGRLDVALWHDYDVAPVEPDPGVDSVRLLDETVFLAVPATRSPDPGDPIGRTRDEAWIVGSPGTLCHTAAMRVCQAAGFAARVRHHADDFTAVLALVAAGQGVALVPELGAAHPPSDVRLVPLDVHRRTRIAYRRGAGGHPVIAACAAALESSTKAYFARTGGGPPRR